MIESGILEGGGEERKEEVGGKEERRWSQDGAEVSEPG